MFYCLVYCFWHLKKWLLGEWMDGWMGVKAGLRIAYSNQKYKKLKITLYCDDSDLASFGIETATNTIKRQETR